MYIYIYIHIHKEIIYLSCIHTPHHHTPRPQATGRGGKTTTNRHHRPQGGGKEDRVDNLKGRKDHDHRPGGACDAATYILYVYSYIHISYMLHLPPILVEPS